MSEYRRPDIPPRTFRDASGDVVEYGSRWDGSPPEDSYSRVGNPERYAPLHVVADALVDFLRQEYQAEAVETVSKEGERVVEILPADPDCAPLALRFTDFPGVDARAGVRKREILPRCGCDACDETWEECADDLETLALAVAEGAVVETIELGGPGGVRAWVGYRVEGQGSGWQLVAQDDALARDAQRLRGLPEGRWRPWPRRGKA